MSARISVEYAICVIYQCVYVQNAHILPVHVFFYRSKYQLEEKTLIFWRLSSKDIKKGSRVNVRVKTP